MSASISVEEERGTYIRSPYHPHNGYYAGAFSREQASRPHASSQVLTLPRS